jgi:phosphoglycolate phosphatase-like HAD superfamily hydrolase
MNKTSIFKEGILLKKKGVILWDIDGTLISTQRNMKVSLHQKVLEYNGFGKIEMSFDAQGITDWEIMHRLLASYDQSIKPEVANHLLNELDSLSEETDQETIFLLLPGVLNFLEKFDSEFWTLGILTGNTNKRTFAKLKKTDIARFFEEDYIFSCKVNEKRLDIAKRAKSSLSSNGIETIVIIGDTPSDISVARDIGAKVISITTGQFSATNLMCHGPDLVIENLEMLHNPIIDFLIKTQSE